MRVTVDQDNSELLSLMTFYNMRARYETTPTMWRTGYGGCHFIVRDLPLHWDEALLERALFRDDASRVWLDGACQMKPMQTLFMKKRLDVSWQEQLREPLDEKSLLALPFWRSRMAPKWLEKRRKRARERRARIAVTWPKPRV